MVKSVRAFTISARHGYGKAWAGYQTLRLCCTVHSVVWAVSQHSSSDGSSASDNFEESSTKRNGDQSGKYQIDLARSISGTGPNARRRVTRQHGSTIHGNSSGHYINAEEIDPTVACSEHRCWAFSNRKPDLQQKESASRDGLTTRLAKVGSEPDATLVQSSKRFHETEANPEFFSRKKMWYMGRINLVNIRAMYCTVHDEVHQGGGRTVRRFGPQ